MTDYIEYSELIFLGFCIFLVGRTFGLINAKIIGEILVGLALGPYALDLVPYSDVLIVIGHIGLIFIVVEVGLYVDIEKLKRVGVRAFFIALTGTILPLASGFGFFMAFGYSISENITAGVVLSSTSIGMASKLLQDHGMLDSYLGSLIAVAAMFDDVFTLVLQPIIFSIGGSTSSDNNNGNLNAWVICQPIVVSICFMVLGIILSSWAVPHSCHFINKLCEIVFKKIKRSSDDNNKDDDDDDDVDLKNERDNGFITDARCVDQFNSIAKNTNLFSNENGSSTNIKDTSDLFTIASLEKVNHMTSGESNADVNDSDDNDGDVIVVVADVDDGNANDVVVNHVVVNDAGVWDLKNIDTVMTNDIVIISDENEVRLQSYQASTLYFVFLLTATSLAMAAGFAGSSELLGAFVGGMAFANIQLVRSSWERNVLPFECLFSLFFATIGFVIPAKEMFRGDLIGLGFLLTIPTILSKVVVGFGVSFKYETLKFDGMILGWAMVARGELGFVIASASVELGMLSEEVFIILVWALLLSTFIAPFIFSFFISRKLRHEENKKNENNTNQEA